VKVVQLAALTAALKAALKVDVMVETTAAWLVGTMAA
jgi:hypothetical protein